MILVCNPFLALLEELSLTGRINQTTAIDDLYRSVSNAPAAESEKLAEGKAITEQLAKLKYDLQHNRQLTCVRCHRQTTEGLPCSQIALVHCLMTASLILRNTTKSWSREDN